MYSIPPVFLISLDQDSVRRKTLEALFPKYYPSFIHINAIDGNALSAKDYYYKTINSSIKIGRTISPAELGCTLSHIKAMVQFLESGEDCALILEDDITGKDKDIEKIFDLVQKLDKNSLLICGGQSSLSHRKYQYGKKTAFDKTLLKVCRFSYVHIFRTCCYVVTQTSARQILDYHQKYLTVADKWDLFFKNTATKIYFADILSHPESLENSHIEKYRARFHTKKPFWKKVFSKNLLTRVYRKIYNPLYSFLLRSQGYKKL